MKGGTKDDRFRETATAKSMGKNAENRGNERPTAKNKSVGNAGQ